MAKVTLDMPDRVWYKLTGIAEKKGIAVSELIADTVEHLISNGPERPLNNLELLSQELKAARANGWHAPIRGKRK